MKTLQVECRKALNSCSLLRSDPAGLLGKDREEALTRLGSGGVMGTRRVVRTCATTAVGKAAD
jgi:hypothetical protein